MNFNNSALRVDWRPQNRKQVEEAKLLYIKARKENRKILSPQGQPVEFFHPSLEGFVIAEKELGDDEFSIRFIDKNGDRRLIWNSRDPKQIKEASSLFSSYLKRGWKAYGIDNDGKRSRRIVRFDAAKEEIYFSETSDTEVLEKFVKKFKRTEVLPRSYPG